MNAILRKAGALAPSVALLLAAQIGPARADIADFFDPVTSMFGGGSKYKTEITPDIPADDLYNDGLAKLKARDYENATKKFQEVEKRFPFSQWARKGLLMTVYAQYEKPAYDDAIASAKRYIELYPKSPDTPYMYYLTGMSYYNQITSVMQDQTNSERAYQAFSALVEKFPTSEYAADAKVKINIARDQIAAKEMQVGRFYLTRKNFSAAVNRFHTVLGKFQTTRYAEEALYRLTEAYLSMGIPHEAETAAAVLGHNYPDSQWYTDAVALLKTDGLAPQEHGESWISKLSKTFKSDKPERGVTPLTAETAR